MINYPSDITRQQFDLIRPALEAVRQRTRPRRQLDLYEIFNVILIFPRNGSQWRQSPP
ncbi:transposase [Lactiplantibacillus plantarum]|nr:transposase [Levilactobacillus brevis]MDN7016544.1 transposase [Lactiplantibacillus plantarum]MDN7050549.1 transposase [Lactiplantibacillus plantarum]MDN7056847.1 transposase [Lactiplantibacillus plantarum]MDN7068816.1 transposase [Lactiplantibacillus plantarum]